MRKAVMAKGGLDKALQKLVQTGEWDKARVDRFRGRVRDHVRGEKPRKAAPEFEKEKPKGGKATKKE